MAARAIVQHRSRSALTSLAQCMCINWVTHMHHVVTPVSLEGGIDILQRQAIMGIGEL